MTDLSGRTCLITGSTNGIGLAAAEALAKLGAEVILHGRDPARLRAATALVRERSGYDRVRGYVADLASLESVRRHAIEKSAAN